MPHTAAVPFHLRRSRDVLAAREFVAELAMAAAERALEGDGSSTGRIEA